MADQSVGLNNYEWCGNETLQSSHWDVITSGFSQIPVVTYMSEFGLVDDSKLAGSCGQSRCIMSPPRLWTEVQALYTSPVSDVFSGGVAFSYFPTSDGYGMVTFSSDGSTFVTTTSARHRPNLV